MHFEDPVGKEPNFMIIHFSNIYEFFTTIYLADHFDNIYYSKLAHGLPMGAHIDYTDEITLKQAITGRTAIKTT